MKKLLSGIIAFAMSLTVAVTPIGENLTSSISNSALTANAEDSGNVIASFTGKYQQTSARDMFPIINNFRTNENPWIWNESDTEKVPVTGLKELKYDYELEKVAMQRAAELVVLYSHTRPNGGRCFTAYTSTYDNTYRAENIAIGTSDLNTGRAFNLWKEEDKTYSGQGHRRNMLSANYNAIGIAHVYYNGCHYWVQEFSSKVGSSVVTPANDSDSQMIVEIAASNINNPVLNSEYETKQVKYQSTEPLPKITCNMKLASQWYAAPSLTFDVTPNWSVTKGSDVVEIDGENYVGIKGGEAELTADCGALGTKTVTITVSEPVSVLEGTIYYQQNLKNNTQIRFIAEISIEDVEKAQSGNYAVKIGENKFSGEILKAYSAIKANGEIITAEEGKYFVITPVINNVEQGTEISVDFSLDIYNNPLTRTVNF